MKDDFTVLDIGANIGYFTLIMAKQAKKVYAFEPEPRNFNTLQQNVEMNNLKNVELYNAAVSETAGDSMLYLCDTNRGMHRLYQSHWCKEGSVKVKTMRIDDVVTHADFVKIDVEGAELGVLKGMKHLLEKRRLTLLMEFHPPSIIEYGARPRDVYDYMRSLGYTVKTYRGESISFEKLEKITTQVAGVNILCTP